ncbi:PEP-CTERM sorting domain-containing protein [Roseibacillus persicicus]
MDNNNSNGANQSDQVYIDDVTLTVTSIPEPSSALLSLLALPFVLRRRR